MKEWLAQFIAQFGPIIFGLLVGTTAFFGGKVAEREPITRSDVVGHLMQLGMISLLAIIIINLLGIEDVNMIAFVAAIMALATADVVKFLKRNGWKNFVTIAVQTKDDKKDGD